MDVQLVTLTADIAAAHVANNAVHPDAVPGLISGIYGALAELGQEPEVEKKPEPAVSIRASVKSDAITCLVCGTKHKMLKRHLGTAHGLTPDEYRARYGLPRDYPMVAPDYADVRRKLALEIGLGRNPNQKRGRRKKA